MRIKMPQKINGTATVRSHQLRKSALSDTINRLKSFTVKLIFFVTISYLTTAGRAALLQGCNFDESLCESGEICVPDGLFGQCYTDAESETLKPLAIDRALNGYEEELLRLELKRLAVNGLNWPHARAQCTLAYFKFSVVYGLPYSAEFCAVRNPNNIWALIQEAQTILASESEASEALLEESLIRNGFLPSNSATSDVDENAPVSNDEDEWAGAAEEPAAGAGGAVLVDDDQAVAAAAVAAAAVKNAADVVEAVAAEESQQQLASANNNSDIFNAAIQQLNDGKADKRAASGQVAVDLADNGVLGGASAEDYDLLSRVPAPADILVNADGTIVRGVDDGGSELFVAANNNNPAVASDERAAAWNAWLATVLATRSMDANNNNLALLPQLLPAASANTAASQLPELSASEEKQLDDYVTNVLNNRRTNLAALNDSQLEKLVAFINSLKVMLQLKAAQLQQNAFSSASESNSGPESSAPEVEEVIPLTSQSNEKQLLLKKDAEKFNNEDMGLSNTEHKIVKGGIQRVEGDRVYLKINEKTKSDVLSETQLTRLIEFLDRKIAAPNDLFFDAFAYENGQLSFRVSRVKFLPVLQQIFDNLNLEDVYDDNSATEGAGMAAGESATKNDNGVAASPSADAAGVDGGENKSIVKQALDTLTLTNDKKKNNNAQQLESASGVAQAVYKRRKDIQTLAGVEVDETGIGSGVDIVPVGGNSRRDWFFASATAVCVISLLVLGSALALQWVRCRRASDATKKPSNANLNEVIDFIEGKPATIYEDLCRQRMNGQDSAVVVPANMHGGGSPSATGTTSPSKLFSTSTWPDDTYLQSCNLDISTGHVILGFLKDCLEKPDEISNQWSQLANYENTTAEKTVSQRPENTDKNFDDSVVPFDDSLVTVSPATQFRTRSRPSSDENENNTKPSGEQQAATAAASRKYVNASRIFDADPRQVAYIAAQAPLTHTVDDFWQAIWQEGVVVIVNLTDWTDNENSLNPVRYWPRANETSKVFGSLEVNLVSEHSFSHDYIVRSIYLKNLNTNETRTVTQFHYVSWKDDGLPRSVESLLEFRRKVNKSYRGHVSPVLVHCTNGAGRTGAYILIDMVMNRILKGVKELNIAGSLEHLRDQRMRLIDNEAQYKLVFRCVAEEVSMLLKNLQH